MKLPRAPKNFPRSRRRLLAFMLGLMAGVVFHYSLYRFSLPSKPFIYVSF